MHGILGTAGCAFESPLEAALLAINGPNPENAGFVRADAALLLVIGSDEDDCSVADPEFYANPQAGIEDPLGPFTSFRCFDHGVVCDPDEPRVPGAKTDCRPDENSELVQAVAPLVSTLFILHRPERVAVAGPALHYRYADADPVELSIRVDCE